ncbi:MAG: hypothetical protein M3R17_15680 [Bacteroidota bacterium]|nr:hypothetical protein [Bacteroidota bacterium]
MKLKNFRAGLFIIVALAFAACATQQRVSTIVGYDYDKTKDKTDYFVLPYGSVSIRGKCDKTFSAGHQQFFINKDWVSLAIGFGAYNQYQFCKSVL